MPRDLLAIDPGNKTGVAWFKGEHLVSVVSIPWGDAVQSSIVGCFVVIECPSTFQRRTKGDPSGADVLKLVRKVGALEQMCRQWRVGCRIVDPSEWKGSVPKHVTKQRVLRCLTEDELKGVPPGLDHNGFDALGLGLWHLGRLQRSGASGATGSGRLK